MAMQVFVNIFKQKHISILPRMLHFDTQLVKVS